MTLTETIKNLYVGNEPDTPMDELESKTLLHILLDKDDNLHKEITQVDENSSTYKHFKPLLKSQPLQILLKRLEILSTVRLTLGALIMLAFYVKNAGYAVIYAHYIHSKLPKNTLVDINIFSIDLFPMGTFSEKQIENIWGRQKVFNEKDIENCHCYAVKDNMLDYTEAWNKEDEIIFAYGSN